MRVRPSPHALAHSLLYNHIGAWDRIARHKHDRFGLVLEDDVKIAQNLVHRLREAAWQLQSQPWDILWPGYCCCTPDGPPVSALLARHRTTGCAQSYLLRPRAAQRMLAALPAEQCEGADHFMNTLFARLPCWRGYALRKSLIQQRDTNPNSSTHRRADEEVVGWAAELPGRPHHPALHGRALSAAAKLSSLFRSPSGERGGKDREPGPQDLVHATLSSLLRSPPGEKRFSKGTGKGSKGAGKGRGAGRGTGRGAATPTRTDEGRRAGVVRSPR